MRNDEFILVLCTCNSTEMTSIIHWTVAELTGVSEQSFVSFHPGGLSVHSFEKRSSLSNGIKHDENGPEDGNCWGGALKP